LKLKAKTVYINIISFLFLAGLLEAFLYFGLAHPRFIPSFLLPLYRKIYLHNDRNVIQYSACARYDSALFYTLKPGNCTFTNREFAVDVFVNSSGLRDDEQSLNAPSIIMAGDSYTMGWGVGQHETYSTHLENRLGVPVLNTGISSYGTARELLMLARLDTRNLRHLVIQYHMSDYAENQTFIENNFSLPIRSEFYYDSVKQKSQSKYFPFKLIYSASSLVGRRFFRSGDEPKPDKFTEADAFLKAIEHSSQDFSKTELLVFTLDNYDNLNEGFLDQVDLLKKTSAYEHLKITTMRLKDTLDQTDFYILDDHLNAAGHEKIARRLAHHLSKKN
jgi:hypothetical protein